MTENRLEKYFENQIMKGKKEVQPDPCDLFENVHFEEFDPTITQRRLISQNMLDDEEEDEEDRDYAMGGYDKKIALEEMDSLVSQTVIMCNESQMINSLSMWIGHCNINLSETLIDNLVAASGVETLDVMTRYRFRVGIGKMFDPGLVKTNLAKIIEKHAKSLS